MAQACSFQGSKINSSETKITFELHDKKVDNFWKNVSMLHTETEYI